MIKFIHQNCLNRLKDNINFESNKCNDCLNSVFYPSSFASIKQDTCQALVSGGYIVNDNHTSYICPILGDLYYCRFCKCYISEYYNALEIIFNNLTKDVLDEFLDINMYSFGCGPCFDLDAYTHKFMPNNLHKKQCLNYYGFDLAESAWLNIHSDINNYNMSNGFDANVVFNYSDILLLQFDEHSPLEKNSINIYNFCYLFSALQEHLYEKHKDEDLEFNKHMLHQDIIDFLNRFINYCREILDDCYLHCIYLVGIDIRSCSGVAGSVQYFDYLITNILNCRDFDIKILTKIDNYLGMSGKFWFPLHNIPIIDFGLSVPEDLENLEKQYSNCARFVIKLTRNYKYVN